MRIRERKSAADCSVSSSSSSSLSSQSSSITAAHSLVSSQGSSISCHFSPPPLPRCRGLDLLVKAIHQVDAGSVVGVPYIQRRVTIRRRRRSGRIEFGAFVLDELPERKRDRISEKVGRNKKAKKGKNLVVQDSVLQPWRRRSDCSDEMGF